MHIRRHTLTRTQTHTAMIMAKIPTTPAVIATANMNTQWQWPQTHMNDNAATNPSTNSSTYTYSVATTATHRRNDHMGHGKYSVAPTRLTQSNSRQQQGPRQRQQLQEMTRQRMASGKASTQENSTIHFHTSRADAQMRGFRG